MLQYGPFSRAPGLVLRFIGPAGPPILIANRPPRPTSMTLNKNPGTLYVSECGGRIVAIPFHNGSWIATTVEFG